MPTVYDGQCSACRFWVPLPRVGTPDSERGAMRHRGRCQRWAPRASVGDWRHIDILPAVWPTTDAMDFCGDGLSDDPTPDESED